MAKSNDHSTGKHGELRDIQDLTYVSLGIGDYDEINSLIKNYFVPFEPMCMGLGVTYDEMKYNMEKLTSKYLEKGLSVGAKTKVGELIGIIMVETEITESILEESAKYAKGMEKPTHRLEIIKHVVGNYDVFSKHQPKEVMYMARMTVHPNYRGQGIVRKMLELAEQKGVEKGIKDAYSIATSIGSQINLQRQGYVTVYEAQFKIFDFLNLTNMGNNASVKLMTKKLI